MSSNELEVLEHYNRKILKYGDCPDVLLKCLAKLDHVRVNIELLGQTGIGLTVNALKKKYGDSEIGTISRDLVSKWKQIVAREDEERERQEEDNNGEEEEDEEASETNEYQASPVTNGHGREESGPNDESSQDEDHHSRKSKKKKSHRERSDDERESSRSEKHHKSKKDKEKEKSHKHKHSERDKERDSSRVEKERQKDHKSSKSSHKDKDKSESRLKEKRGEHNKHRPSDNTAASSKNHEARESHASSDKKHKTRQRDLASFDMFSSGPVDSDDDRKSVKNRKRHHGDEPGAEEVPRSKQARMSSSSSSVSDYSNKYSLPSSLSSSALIPEISPIYKPLPRPNINMLDRGSGGPENKDDIDLTLLLSHKNRGRSAIYSGIKRTGYFGEVPSLHQQCIQVLKENVEYIEEVGGLGYDIMKPVLVMANATTLLRIEDCNPHLMEDTGELWEKFVRKEFYNKERQAMESWREMYERCVQERAVKLDALKGKVKSLYKSEEDQHRKTKLAYVDIVPKAPKSVRNVQARNGTALPNGTPLVAGGPRPRNLIQDPTANASRAYVAPKKPKTAPLMAKTFKLMRGIKGGFRR